MTSTINSFIDACGLKRVWPLLLIYGVLAAVFWRATPPLEASDEARHFGYVVELKRHGALPRAFKGQSGLARQEATQPPLYYALCSLLISRRQIADAEQIYRWRPGNPVGRADLPGYKHMWMFAETKDRSHPAAEALQSLRWFSALLGGIMVYAAWLLCSQLGPQRAHTPMLAAGLVALNPMFLFITSSVNNDALLMPLCTLALWALLKAANRPGWFWLAGALMGLGVMTKLSALVLLLPAGIMLMRQGGPTPAARIRSGLALAVPGLLICGWWFGRNLILYGQLLATGAHVKLAGNARAALEPLALFKEWEGFVKSYWGVFGGFNVIYPDWVYYGFFALSALIVWCACRLGLRPNLQRGYYWALCGQGLANLASVAVWTSFLWGSQGRLLFPSLGALACLLAWEQDHWPRPRGLALTIGILCALAGASLWAGLCIIPKSYP